MGLISLLGTPYAVLLPVFAKDVYLGGPETLGMLTSAIGCGALIAGLRLASRRSVLGLGKWIAIGGVVMGVSLITLSLSSSVSLGVICLVFCGFAHLTQMASSNTVLQLVVDDDKRGRAMAFHAMAFQGMMPLGSLMAGSLATTSIGAGGTVAICGVCCIFAGIWFAIQLPRLRRATMPIYIQRGILPPIASDSAPNERPAQERALAQ